MEIKCIKGVDEKTWRDFKSLAAKNNLKMSLLLKIMIKEFEKQSSDFWGKILNNGKNLTDKEAEDMENSIKKLREEKGFRE